MLEAVSSGERVEALDRDEALLTILYKAAGNDVLLELIRSLWQGCRAYKLVGVQGALADADPELWASQGRLITAALAHDADTAAAITERSLLTSITRIRAMLV